MFRAENPESREMEQKPPLFLFRGLHAGSATAALHPKGSEGLFHAGRPPAAFARKKFLGLFSRRSAPSRFRAKKIFGCFLKEILINPYEKLVKPY